MGSGSGYAKNALVGGINERHNDMSKTANFVIITKYGSMISSGDVYMSITGKNGKITSRKVDVRWKR